MDKLNDMEQKIKMEVLEEIKDMLRQILPAELELPEEPMMEQSEEMQETLPPLEELPELGAEKVTVMADSPKGLKEGLEKAEEIVEEMPEDKDKMLKKMKDKLARMRG